MARLWNCGSELNSTTANVEYTQIAGSGIAISTNAVRTGTYSLRCNGLVSAQSSLGAYQFVSANSNGPFYFRFYLNVSTYPSADNPIFTLRDSGATARALLSLGSTGTLKISDSSGSNFATGPTLSKGGWYMVEFLFDVSGAGGSHVLRAKVNGGQLFGATNRSLPNGVTTVRFGGNLAQSPNSQTQGDWSFDDMAINDSTGSFQNTWCGPGALLYLRPNAAGDANSFATQVGGTAGSANNYTRVKEVTPDDATSYNASSTLNQEDLFNCMDSGINAADRVNLVAIGARFADLTGADATSGVKFEVIKTSGGTKSQSANTVPNTTTWNSNATAAPRNPPLTLYQDPDGANWGKGTLDSMQIGYILDAFSVRAVAISAIWAIVDYTPATNRFFQML